ncbi:hypothetical protein DUNSADRAFT_4074 [Dunaliella salina]|uniref:Uncharacterized protein n=1 Tax=Dunaliella salina TaxID=3046 RepID=A0ABQ7GSP2_DUNSA|nr:hypothetical protein DUNSADRAFT_4074 [Dunaliella salina]|eukprot:KAF5837641.1 hypothetical protein DUNSADRAFT_4074 [Dunaliella salina]
MSGEVENGVEAELGAKKELLSPASNSDIGTIGFFTLQVLPLANCFSHLVLPDCRDVHFWHCACHKRLVPG